MREILRSTNGHGATVKTPMARTEETPPEKVRVEEHTSSRLGKLWAALRATAPVAPFAAVGITVVAYTEGYELPAGLPALFTTNPAVAIGFLAALIAWLVLAVSYYPYTGTDSVSIRNYNQLRQRLGSLDVRLRHARPEGYRPPGGDGCARNNVKFEKLGDGYVATGPAGGLRCGCESELSVARRLAHDEAKNERDEIRRGLRSAGMPWVRGLGYVQLWHSVHRAEEALTRVEPATEALAGAMRDESRLEHANMKSRDVLLRRLKKAAATLEGCEDGVGPLARAKALNTLSEVQYEINHFRDDVWEGIVHARNRFSDTSVVLGVAAYALLLLAVFTQPPSPAPPSEAIVWVSVYFLIGALTGLFARAQAEWNMNTAIDDFGLSFAQLISTPWLSGLAAVGGVFLTSVLGGQLLGREPDSKLVTIFANEPSLLVVAAVFGLAPDLFVRRLMQQVESYKEDLQSTKSSQSTKSGQGSGNARLDRSGR